MSEDNRLRESTSAARSTQARWFGALGSSLVAALLMSACGGPNETPSASESTPSSTPSDSNDTTDVASNGGLPDLATLVPNDPRLPAGVKVGYIKSGSKSQKIFYQTVEGIDLFEGDVVVHPTDEPEPETAESGGFGADGNSRIDWAHLWPSGILLFKYDPSVSAALQTTIQNAMIDIQNKTHIRFRQANSDEPDFVLFKQPTNAGCNSWLGRLGGAQDLNLSINSSSTCNSLDIVVHEIGHALGLIHEHSHPDRNRYLNIILANIQTAQQSQFAINNGARVFNTVDFDSVMMYNSFNSFANDKTKPTMTRKDGSTFVSQDGKGLSQGDVRGIQTMYGMAFEDTLAAASAAQNRLDVMWRSPDGHYRWKRSLDASGWNATTDLGGPATAGGRFDGPPVLCLKNPDTKELWAFGLAPQPAGGQIFYRRFTGDATESSWSQMPQHSPPFASPPVVVYRGGPNRVMVIAKDADGIPWVSNQLTTGTQTWSNWTQLYNQPIASLTAMYWPLRDEVHLFSATPVGAVIHRWSTGTTWPAVSQPWEFMGGTHIVGQVTAIPETGTRIDLFARTSDGNAILTKTYDTSTGWVPSLTDWTNLGGSLIGSPKPVVPILGGVMVFAQGANDGQIYFKTAAEGANWSASWSPIGGNITGSPVVVNRGVYTFDVVVRGGIDATLNSRGLRPTDGTINFPTWTNWVGLGETIAY